MALVINILPFLIAIGIGLAIGIERERRYANMNKAMGVRTFTLLALLGALASHVQAPFIAAIIALLAASLIVASYFVTNMNKGQPSVDIGLTTEFAAGVTFVVAYLAQSEPLLSVILGLLTLIVLLSREKIHEFSIHQIRPEEIEAAVILGLLAVGILPLLPNEPIDPWGILSLHRFMLLLILIGSLQFIGYVASRFFGAMVGFSLTGFISGFVSSTAVFLTMPKYVKEDAKMMPAAVAASLFAAASTFILLLIVVGAVSIPLLRHIGPPLAASIAIALVGAYVFSRLEAKDSVFPMPKNPLSIVGSLKLAVFLSVFVMAIGLIQHFVGDVGTQVASFMVGLGELHGVSIASASLFANGAITAKAAQSNILLAALASLVSKLIITWILIRGRYALWVSVVTALMIAGFVLAWWLI